MVVRVMTENNNNQLNINTSKTGQHQEAYTLRIGNKNYDIFYYRKAGNVKDNDQINIFASGPSIQEVEFNDDIQAQPSIFVNGSLSLIEKYNFSNIVAYVISDYRFIQHNTQILEQLYKGQPLFITKPVLDEIADNLPILIEKYCHSIRLIYPVDRPITAEHDLKFLPLLSKLFKKKLNLYHLKNDRNFIIESVSHSKPIGVSLNIEKGFVEAGTVAYVATQLAFSFGAKEIHLYGIDLINSNQPRFYEDKDNFAPCKLDKAITDRIVPSFNLLARTYRKYGVKVMNHSPVSKDLLTEM